MYILANAVKNLLRNKGRNLLLAVVTLVIVASTVVTLTISNAAARVIDEIKLDIGSKVEISQDLIGMHEVGLGREDASYISIEDFFAFAQSDYLSRAIFNADMYAWSDTLRAVGDYGETPGAATRVNDDGREVVVETCKLVSTEDPGSLADFGTLRELVDGRMFQAQDECIVGEELAQTNNLTEGSIIDLYGAFDTNKEFHLTVVGIYSDQTDEYINPMFQMNGRYADSRRNEVIVSFDTLMAAGWVSNRGLHMKTAYYLKNPDEITAFEQEVRAKGLPVTYDVSINQDAYDKVSGPLAGVNGAVTTFMAVILVLGAITLALISFMAVRERKYEVGVLRAMGMERRKVAMGILAESVIVAVLCLGIGLGAGSAMAQPLADGMLEERVAEATAADAAPQRNTVLFAAGQMQTSDTAAGFQPESEIQVHLNSDVLLQIVFITLGLAALSGLIGVVMITKYEPLKILRERN